ncbi:MAG: hypothetical protein U0905_22360 [Pirellulales bacterium]
MGRSAPVTLPVSGGTFSRISTDDNPTNTSSDTYTIGVVLTDDDTGTAVGKRVTTTTANVNPEILTLNATSVNEDGTVTLSGYLHRRRHSRHAYRRSIGAKRAP